MIDSKRLTAWYNFQAPAYHLWRDNYDGALVQRVSQLLGEGQNGAPLKVLDAGCGSGLFTIGLAKRHPTWTFQGIDPSMGLLKIGRKQAAKRKLANAAFIEGDVMALPYAGGEFDVVLAAGLFPNLNDHAAAMREMARTLKPGGQAVIVEFDRASMTRGTKLFFKGMIAAYKMVSCVFRRFRFADKWNVENSTIDGEKFARELAAAALEPKAVHREHNHYVFHCTRREH